MACAAAAVLVLVFGSPGILAVFAVATAPAVLVLTRQALLRHEAPDGTVHWYPAGHLLGWTAALALAGLGGAALLLAGTEGGLEGAMRALVREWLAGSGLIEPDDQTAGALADLFARFAPGLIAASWMFMVVVNATVAQWALSRFGHAIRPSPAFHAVTLPRWVIGAFAAALVASLLPGQLGMVGQNAVIVLTVPFLLLGLAIIHALSVPWSGRGLILFALYLLMVLFSWPALLVTIVGLLDPWVDWRRRFGARPRDEEGP